LVAEFAEGGVGVGSDRFLEAFAVGVQLRRPAWTG
jgi:hypothetical protein